MEPELKLAATASCQGQGVHSGSIMVDRISNLPDQVAHHILSFLTIPHLARFGCVSRRCRELCLTAPSLDFDDLSELYGCECRELQRWLNCLDRFFFLRGSNKIQRFRVRWMSHFAEESDDDSDGTLCSCDEYFRIISWIHNAVGCNVEELDLDIGAGDAVAPTFPSSVFLCGSLKSLSVDLNLTGLGVPLSAFSSNLKYLELRSGVVDEEFFKWISCNCKCIEKLFLEEVSVENITIASLSLKIFSFVGDNSVCRLNISGEKLEAVRIDWLNASPSDKSLTIFAPCLKALSWKGNLMTHRNLGMFEFLEEAVILLKPKVDDFDSAFEVLRSVHRAKVLILNESTIKALFRQGSMLAPLHGACSLRMNIRSFADELVPAMVSLFKRMPNLCTLCIDSKRPLYDPKDHTSGCDMEYWKMQNLGFVLQLKEVTIQPSLGTNEIELIRYILEYAKSLEKMLIIHFPLDVDDLKTKLGKSMKVSNAKVIFKAKHEG